MTLDMVRYLFMNTLPFNSYLISSLNKTAESDFIKWRKSHNFTLNDIYERLGPTTDDTMDLYGTETLDYIHTMDYGRCLKIKSNENITRVGKNLSNE